MVMEEWNQSVQNKEAKETKSKENGKIRINITRRYKTRW